MESTCAPDPFAALGLPSNATSADIKSAYRKLALKCHPDKVADEALKKVKQEEFHKIQQAYELIGDDERLESYKAEQKLEALRRAKFASRAASGPNVARYDVRTAAPSGSGGAAHRYEERKPTASRSFEDDYHNSRSTRYDTYEAYPTKQSSSTRTSRPEKEPVRVTRVATDRSRSDRNKTRDKEERRSRTEKFAHMDEDPSSNDEKVRFEAKYMKNGEDARVRDSAADLRKKVDERIKVEEAARKKSESRRSYEDRETIKEPRRQNSDDRELEHHRKQAAAEAYIKKTMTNAQGPSPSRTTTRDVAHDPAYESSRSRRERPEHVRRSSARPRDRDRGDRVVPEIVDWERPSIQKSSSSPAEIKLPQRATPIRSQTELPRESRRADKSPTPQFRRADTAPTGHMSSSSRREDYKSRPSTLRSSESLPHSTSPPENAYPSIPHAQPSSSSSKRYYYTTTPSGTRERDPHADVANGHPAILREPNRHRTRSPSPLSTRPPMGTNRHTEAHAQPRNTSLNTPPPLSRSQTSYADSDMHRGRPRLFNETTPEEYLRRPEVRRQNSHSPHKAPHVSSSRKYTHEDIVFARRGHGEFSKPTLGRSATMTAY